MNTAIINSPYDIAPWIRNNCNCWDIQFRLADAVAEADHPAYGTDWSEWLDSNVPALEAQIVEAEEGPGFVIPSSAAREVWGHRGV